MGQTYYDTLHSKTKKQMKLESVSNYMPQYTRSILALHV